MSDRSVRIVLLGLLSAALLASPGRAVADASTDESSIRSIPWITGPVQGALGTVATIRVPAGFAFTGEQGTKKFMDLTHNPSSGDELGVMLPTDSSGWFAVFEFHEIGYVKDDEKNRLDADKLLSSIREGTKEANEERKKRGWPPLEVLGWYQVPMYDPETHNLVWAIRGRSEGTEVINYSTRLLGRRGVMEVDLVVDPKGMRTSLPQFQSVLSGFAYSSGNSYAEFRQGDKIAKYGLAALIVGGAAVAAAKSGILVKFAKAIVLGVIGLFAAIARWFKRTFGGEDPSGGGTPT
jgi:uncharacterized membrane-anchored protein